MGRLGGVEEGETSRKTLTRGPRNTGQWCTPAPHPSPDDDDDETGVFVDHRIHPESTLQSLKTLDSE